MTRTLRLQALIVKQVDRQDQGQKAAAAAGDEADAEQG